MSPEYTTGPMSRTPRRPYKPYRRLGVGSDVQVQRSTPIAVEAVRRSPLLEIFDLVREGATEVRRFKAASDRVDALRDSSAKVLVNEQMPGIMSNLSLAIEAGEFTIQGDETPEAAAKRHWGDVDFGNTDQGLRASKLGLAPFLTKAVPLLQDEYDKTRRRLGNQHLHSSIGPLVGDGDPLFNARNYPGGDKGYTNDIGDTWNLMYTGAAKLMNPNDAYDSSKLAFMELLKIHAATGSERFPLLKEWMYSKAEADEQFTISKSDIEGLENRYESNRDKLRISGAKNEVLGYIQSQEEPLSPAEIERKIADASEKYSLEPLGVDAVNRSVRSYTTGFEKLARQTDLANAASEADYDNPYDAWSLFDRTFPEATKEEIANFAQKAHALRQVEYVNSSIEIAAQIQGLQSELDGLSPEEPRRVEVELELTQLNTKLEVEREEYFHSTSNFFLAGGQEVPSWKDGLGLGSEVNRPSLFQLQNSLNELTTEEDRQSHLRGDGYFNALNNAYTLYEQLGQYDKSVLDSHVGSVENGQFWRDVALLLPHMGGDTPENRLQAFIMADTAYENPLSAQKEKRLDVSLALLAPDDNGAFLDIGDVFEKVGLGELPDKDKQRFNEFMHARNYDEVQVRISERASFLLRSGAQHDTALAVGAAIKESLESFYPHKSGGVIHAVDTRVLGRIAEYSVVNNAVIAHYFQNNPDNGYGTFNESTGAIDWEPDAPRLMLLPTGIPDQFTLAHAHHGLTGPVPNAPTFSLSSLNDAVVDAKDRMQEAAKEAEDVARKDEERQREIQARYEEFARRAREARENRGKSKTNLPRNTSAIGRFLQVFTEEGLSFSDFIDMWKDTPTPELGNPSFPNALPPSREPFVEVGSAILGAMYPGSDWASLLRRTAPPGAGRASWDERLARAKKDRRHSRTHPSLRPTPGRTSRGWRSPLPPEKQASTNFIERFADGLFEESSVVSDLVGPDISNVIDSQMERLDIAGSFWGWLESAGIDPSELSLVVLEEAWRITYPLPGQIMERPVLDEEEREGLRERTRMDLTERGRQLHQQAAGDARPQGEAE